MNDITPKEAIEILRHYTDLGYGIVIEGEDTSKIKQALSLAVEILDFKEEIIRMVNMGVYPEAIIEWVRESEGE